jgi:hypothetical protein
LSKPAAFRGWICALCIVPVLAIIAVTLLAFSPARHGQARSAASVAPKQASVTPTARGRVQASYAALPLSFEANQGQTDSQVKYMARGDGYTLFLTANDAVFSLQSRSSQKSKSARHARKDSNAVVHMQLQGGNSLAKVSASNQLPGKSNYFLGNDPSKWHAEVPHFARVSYQDVYPGVNLAFHGAQRQTEFDFVVAPGANPAPIAFHFTGAQGIKTDDSGNLIISSAAGNVQLHKPVAYQEQNGARQLVGASFVLKADNQVAFELGNYDRSRELVIDPSVGYAYSTYLGGSGADEGQGIAFDGSGNAYVTGQTASADFPGATSTNKLKGVMNVFVTQITATGTLGYSTYVGGSKSDSGNSIAIDASGNAFVTGGTTSTDFPVMPNPGAFQTTLNSTKGNAFVFELGSNGSTIVYSTYLGGTGTTGDVALGIAMAAGGDVYVVGKTSSTDFPGTSSSPLQPAPLAGSKNAGFVTKVNSTGTALVYSTYLGGSSTGDTASAVAVDSKDDAYVTGQTSNAGFPKTTGVVQATYGGGTDAFVTAINPTGTAYLYSTFLGGGSLDIGDGIAVDSAGDAYVTGLTTSSSPTPFPTTAGALQVTYGGSTDAFVTKLNPAGTALLYSTYIGGSGFDAGASIAVDANNSAYITGQTNSPATSFPLVGATQPALGGGFDAFVSEINPAGSQLIFSTYLGGSGNEDVGGNYGAIAVDSVGANIYVTGNTDSTNFPVSSSPLQATNKGATDAFVVKYSQSSAASTFSLSATALNPGTVSPGGSATSMVTATGVNFTGTVTLTCAVTGPAGAVHLPTCAAASATAGGSAATLTVNTTAATALLERPASRHSAGMFYAMFLPIGGIALLGFGSAGSQRKKLFGFLLVGLVLSCLLLMPACGGSGNNNNGGGSPGTTAGAYTITVNGTASGATQTGTAPALTLTVN